MKDPLERLNTTAAAHFRAFLADAKTQGYGRLYVLETYRPQERQAQLYGQGRSAWQLRLAGVDPKYARPKLPRVTNAKPGTSMHEYGLAMDVKIDNYPEEHYKIIGAIARKHGLTWGGDWKMRDYRHVQYTGGFTERQIRAGKRPVV